MCDVNGYSEADRSKPAERDWAGDIAANGSSLYGSIAAAREVGISLRQLYHWADTLHVVIANRGRHGTREFRQFTREDLIKLGEMRRWVEGGYTPRAAAEIVSGRRRPLRENPQA